MSQMSQSLSRVLVHVVFSTKNRQPLIRPQDLGPLAGYLTGAVRGAGCDSIQIGGTADHIHALLALGRVCSVSSVVEDMKVQSSKWMKARGVIDFSFSIGASQVETLRRYILRQEEHHRTASFQDELRTVLRRYGVSFDERYIWR